MKPATYCVRRGTSPKFGRAFSSGCRGPLYRDTIYRPGPVAMFGSPPLWDILQRTRREGFDWYYCDHAYFRRNRYYRVTRNAYQHDGSGHAKDDRFRSLNIPMRPWRTSGRHVLVCPPDQAFASLMGFDAEGWLAGVLSELAAHTDRPIRVRGRHGNASPLVADLADCWALVTYTSNAAVEAVLEGVPVFCTARCAGLAMGTHNLSMIETPLTPDREQWAWNLAANQWTLSEIALGHCWRAIGR